MNVQIIEKNGKPEYAVVPYSDYIRLLEEAEMLQDIQDYDEIKAAIDQGAEQLVPSEVVYAIMDGENPIKVWRKQRGLPLHELAEKAGISASYLSQLESGKRKGTVETLNRIALCLGVSLEDIFPA